MGAVHTADFHDVQIRVVQHLDAVATSWKYCVSDMELKWDIGVQVPNNLRMRCALCIKSRLPTTIEPTGALSPFERQNIIESAVRTKVLTGIRSAMAALKTRAPSMCTIKP